MLDLRLIAGILFGVKPSSADMERMLVEEATRRHKYRYPATEPRSKRGPPGTSWYVMDVRWWMSWRDHTGGTLNGVPTGRRRRNMSFSLSDDASTVSVDTSEGGFSEVGLDEALTPGRIDNKALLEPGGLALRRGLKWHRDFELVPPLAWHALHAWHDGGPTIRRSVVSCGSSLGSSSVMASPGRKNARGSIKTSRTALTHNEIELYPLFATVQLCDSKSSHGSDSAPFREAVPLSRHLPIRDILDRLCQDMGDISPKNARLWLNAESLDLLRLASSENGAPDISRGEGESQDHILYLDASLDEQLSERGVSGDMLSSGSSLTKENESGSESGSPKLVLILEVRDDKDSPWPRSLHNSTSHHRAVCDGTGEGGKDGTRKASVKDGNVGLYTMGHTGYLNASIQCLSHTPILSDYFRTKAYVTALDKNNPRGQQGELAELCAILISELWKRSGSDSETRVHKSPTLNSDQYTPIQAPALAPKSFKEAIGRLNKRFEGSDPVDAQELLSFLLSALSEDLNIVTDQDSAGSASAEDLSEQEAADVWWSKQLEREMSIVKALFTGQYKSVVTCLSCNRTSTSFEPSAFLQLPLPRREDISVPLILYQLRNEEWPDSGIAATKYEVVVRHDGTLHDILISLAKLLHVDNMDKSKNIDCSDVSGTNAGSDEQNMSGCEGNDNEDDSMVYEQAAQNMVIVKMKEGYISNVVPPKWPLSKMKSRDTGDLELLHVYELDPLPCDNPDDSDESMDIGADIDKETLMNRLKSDSNDTTHSESSTNLSTTEYVSFSNETMSADTSKASKKSTGAHSFLAIVQRKLDLVARPIFHPYLQNVFGTPLILRVQGLEDFTGCELYDLVAKKIGHLVPKSARSFLLASQYFPSGSVAETPQDSMRSIESNSQVLRQRSTAEDASTGQLPRYGFMLRTSSRDGKCCSLCPWYECCLGCLIPDDDNQTVLANGDSIALDWHTIVDLCSLGFESAHSKASNTNTSLTRRPQLFKKHSSCCGGSKELNRALSLEECLGAFSREERMPKAFCSQCNESHIHTRLLSCVKLPPIIIVHLKRFLTEDDVMRKLQDLVVFPTEGVDFLQLLSCEGSFVTKKQLSAKEKSTGILEEEEEIRGRIWSNGAGQRGLNRSSSDKSEQLEPVYDIYAVVHHSGPPSSGHCVASVRSQMDGKWRLFNDAAIYEISTHDVVDSSSYILFYVRRDLKSSTVQDFWSPTLHKSNDLAEEN